MSLNWKKILAVIAFIVSVIIIGYLIYLFFLKPISPAPPVNGNVNGQPGVLPPGVNGNVAINVNGQPGALPPGAHVNISVPTTVTPTPPAVSPVASGGVTEVSRVSDVRTYGTTLSADGSGILYYDKNSGLFY